MSGLPPAFSTADSWQRRETTAGSVALEQALIQASVGYELTTGFVILPR